MGKGQRIKATIYDDWAKANIADKGDIGIASITDRTSIVHNELEEMKKEIEQIKAKQQNRRKIIIKVR